jgi:hypothetical protein
VVSLEFLLPVIGVLSIAFWAVFYEKIGFLRTVCLSTILMSLVYVWFYPQVAVLVGLGLPTSIFFFVILTSFIISVPLTTLVTIGFNKIMKYFFRRLYNRLTQISPR